MKVKVCGITRQQDALLAIDAGVWAIGFIFVKNTPRYISPEKSLEIIKNLPASVEKVGVFADLPIDEVTKIIKLAKITKIQLHGDESPEYVSALHKASGLKIIKAVKIKDINDLELILRYKSIVNYILLDTFSEKQQGGTGKTFDWEIARAAKKFNIPIILAGGLNPENISDAFLAVKPFALDLSSGVEAEKGIKDKNKLNQLKIVINNYTTEFILNNPGYTEKK